MFLEIIAMHVFSVGCGVFFLCDAYLAACAVQHDANRATSAVVLFLFVVCNLQGSDCSFVLFFFALRLFQVSEVSSFAWLRF